MDIPMSAFEEFGVAQDAQVSAQAHQLNHSSGILNFSKHNFDILYLWGTGFYHPIEPFMMGVAAVLPVVYVCKNGAHEDEVDDHDA